MSKVQKDKGAHLKTEPMDPVDGHFGRYGGQFVADTLMHPLWELERAYLKWKDDADFVQELEEYLRDYVGRPSPLYSAKRWSENL